MKSVQCTSFFLLLWIRECFAKGSLLWKGMIKLHWGDREGARNSLAEGACMNPVVGSGLVTSSPIHSHSMPIWSQNCDVI